MGLFNQLQIPRSENSFLRTNLFELLDRYFTRPLLSVVAGGGYGKTTVVADYLRSRDLPAIWFSFHAINHSFQSFIELFAKGLSQRESLLEIDKEIDLLETLAHWSKTTAIVLDDFHLVDDSPEFRDFLLQLIQHSSSFVTFVVISRQRPSFPYTKLKMQNRLAELSEKQLEFTLEEMNQYFQLNGLELAEHELELVKLKTSGWPASLPLVIEAWKDLNPKNRRFEWHLFPFSDLFEELEPELLTSSSAEMRAFLFQSSVIHEWDDQLLTSFFPALSAGWPDDRLKQRFFHRKNQDGKYSCLPLFRMYLYEKLLDTKGKQEARQLHLKAANHYESQYHYYFAFAHFLAANDYRNAARIMQKMMNLYTPERFILLLDGSLETICPSISRAVFSHFLFRSVPVTFLNSYIDPLKQTLADLKQQRLSQAIVYLEHRLGIILFYTGEIQEALSLFLSSYIGSEMLGLSDLVSVNLALAAQCCRFSGMLDEGTAYARIALTIIEQEGTVDSRMHAIWILTELLLEQNEIARAEPFVEELLRLSNEYDDEGARVYPLIAIGKYYRLKGELDKASHFTNLGLMEAEKFQLDLDLGWGYFELGLISITKADQTLAEEYLQKSLQYFSPYSYFSSMVNQSLHLLRCAPKDDVESTVVHEPSSKLSIQLLGSFRLEQGGNPITIQRKSSFRLLFYLAVHYNQKIPKDILLEELFSEGSYSSQNNRFYVSISTLRKALEPDLASARMSKYIIQSGELFYLDKNQCDIDLDGFRRMITPIEGQSVEERIVKLKKAESLYRGDLLAEYPYDSFLEPLRESTKQSYLQVLQELGQYFFRQQDFTQGIHFYDLILKHDEYAEAIYWDYVHLLVQNGLLSNAKQIGLKMEQVIEGELGVPVKEKLRGLLKANS